MLTSDQVLGSVYKGKLKPAFVFPEKFQHFGTLENLLELFRVSSGRAMGELREEAADLVGSMEGPGSFWKGLIRVLESRLKLNPLESVMDWQKRLEIFREAARLRLEGKLDRHGMNLLIRRQAQTLDISENSLIEGLYSDFPGNETIADFEEISGTGLLEEYNLALAQGLALRAESIEISLKGEGARELRRLVAGAKFHRLHWEISEHAGQGTRIRFDGPMSLFDSTTKYGIQLACFLPNILGLEGCQISTRLKWGKKPTRPVQWDFMAGDAPLPSRLAPDHPRFPELDALEKLFNEQIRDWKMAPCRRVIPLGNGKFWIPDYRVQSNLDNKFLYVEVFSQGTRERMTNLALVLENNPSLPWLFVAQGNAKPGDQDNPAIYRFRSFPSPEKILPYLDRRAVKPPPDDSGME